MLLLLLNSGACTYPALSCSTERKRSRKVCKPFPASPAFAVKLLLSLISLLFTFVLCASFYHRYPLSLHTAGLLWSVMAAAAGPRRRWHAYIFDYIFHHHVFIRGKNLFLMFFSMTQTAKKNQTFFCCDFKYFVDLYPIKLKMGSSSLAMFRRALSI